MEPYTCFPTEARLTLDLFEQATRRPSYLTGGRGWGSNPGAARKRLRGMVVDCAHTLYLKEASNGLAFDGDRLTALVKRIGQIIWCKSRSVTWHKWDTADLSQRALDSTEQGWFAGCTLTARGIITLAQDDIYAEERVAKEIEARLKHSHILQSSMAEVFATAQAAKMEDALCEAILGKVGVLTYLQKTGCPKSAKALLQKTARDALK